MLDVVVYRNGEISDAYETDETQEQVLAVYRREAERDHNIRVDVHPHDETWPLNIECPTYY